MFVLLAFACGDIEAKLEADGTIRVIAPGAFETTFTRRKGFGATWFDLKHDPEKKYDLAPVLDENGFFWVKLGRVFVSAELSYPTERGGQVATKFCRTPSRQNPRKAESAVKRTISGSKRPIGGLTPRETAQEGQGRGV